jgi:hypothetical protein
MNRIILIKRLSRIHYRDIKEVLVGGAGRWIAGSAMIINFRNNNN